MASSRIKGITIEIGGDTTKLVSALSKVDSAIRETQTNLRDINKALKMDPTSVDLLRSKQEALNDRVAEAKEKLETEKRALEELKKSDAFDETSKEAKDLQTQIALDEAELKNAKKELKDFGSVGVQELNAVAEKMKSVGDKITAVGDNLTKKVTLPLVAVGTVGVTKFAEVDKTMQLTNATMANTTEEAELLNQAMKDAAANSTFGMSEAATATLNFARAGLDAQQAAAALAPAMNLAAGEGGNLDVVSAGLVATINGFGGSFDEAAQYADVFANACNNSALDIDSLSEAMSVAAPIFSAAGYSVEDAALYMGTMANAGIEASVAANALKTGMARLVKPAKEGKQWMDELGISVTNADGSMKDSITVQAELNKAFSGLSESEQIAAASAIFGKNQMSNWLALINTAPSDVSALSDALNEEGTTMEMADAMMSGFGGSLEKLKSSIDVAATSLGEALAPMILKVSDAIQKMVDWFNSLSSGQREVVAKIALIVAAIGPVLLIIGKLVTTISALIPVVTAISTFITATVVPAITAVGAPIIAIVAAVAAVIAIIVLLVKHWDEIKAKTEEVVQAMSQKWAEFKDKVQKAVSDLVEKVKNFFTNLKTTAVNIWNTLVNAVTTLIANLVIGAINKFNELKEKISNVVTNVKNAITTGFTNAVNVIKSFPSQALNWGRDLINNFVQGIKDRIQAVKDAISNVANTVKQYIHFTEPDKGPLSDFHTYAPDMIDTFSKGILASIPQLERAMNTMAGSVAGSLPRATGETNNLSNNVSINVYGAQGQDVNELAQIIEQTITDNVIRRGVAFS